MGKWDSFFKYWNVDAMKVVTVAPLVVGAEYTMYNRHTENPFNRLPAPTARIKDIQEGWVLYEILGPGLMWKNESMRVSDFLKVYNIPL